MKHARPVLSRIVSAALAVVLTAGLAPAPAFAAPEAEDAVAGQASSSETAAASGSSAEASEASSPEAAPGQALVLYREPAAEARGGEASLLSAAGDLSVLETWDFSTVDRALESGAVARSAVAEDGQASDVPAGEDVRIALVERPGADAAELAAELSGLDGVVAAEPNYLFEMARPAEAPAPVESAVLAESGREESSASSADEAAEASVASAADAASTAGAPESSAGTAAAAASADSAEGPTTDDPLVRFQHGYGAGPGGIDLDAALAARAASSSASSGKNIVAVVDGSVDANHPDLAGVMWENPGIEGLPGEAGDHGYDFIEGDSDVTPADNHGTHCAGIIAAQTSNGEGVAGGSSDTEIMTLKVGEADDLSVYASSIISAYQYVAGAMLAGENVVAVNNSWTTRIRSRVVEYAMTQVGRLGALSVVAAGNNSVDVASDSSLPLSDCPYVLAVTATNDSNEYAGFSDYGETTIDVAAPGSNILSTVPQELAAGYFDPAVSRAAGRELAYYNDFSDFEDAEADYRVSTGVGSEMEPVENSEDAFSVEPVASGPSGQPGLEVTVDADALAASHGVYDSCAVVEISWDVDNFLAESADPSDYCIALHAEGMSGDWSSQTFCDAVALLRSSDGTRIGRGEVLTGYDEVYQVAQPLTGLDAADEQLKAYMYVYLFNEDGSPLEGEISIFVTGYGVGFTDEGAADGEGAAASSIVPYAVLNGSSMAGPFVAGAVAQLAALNPDASALELRGMVVGSTVPVDKDGWGSEKSTATDGRFSWDVALDPEAVSANTWSLETDAASGTATAHGYALSDAEVSFDGEPAQVVERADDRVVFRIPDDAFDGALHRVDVTDASTGRVHKAAYTVSVPAEGASAGLVPVAPLPDEAGSGAGAQLVSAPEGLYLADAVAGGYFCRAEDPDAGRWEVLPAPGSPRIDIVQNDLFPTVHYASFDGGVVAFARNVEESDDAGHARFLVLSAFYDPEANEWTPWETVYAREVEATSIAIRDEMASTVHDGVLYFYTWYTGVLADGGTVNTYIVLQREAGSDGFSLRFEGEPNAHVLQLAWVDGGLASLSMSVDPAEDGGDQLSLVRDRLDPATGAWSTEHRFDDVVPSNPDDATVAYRAVSAMDGGLAFLAGTPFAGLGDAVSVDLATDEVRGAGGIVEGSTEGVAVSAAAVFEGELWATVLAEDGAQWLAVLDRGSWELLSGEECPSAGFPDVDQDAWYHGAIDWAVSSGALSGYADGSMGPDDPATRAQTAQVLYNLAGRPAAGGEPGQESFSDVEEGAWYAEAVAWAASEGLFAGYDDGTGRFGPDDPLTREQAAAVLMRAAALSGEDVSGRAELSAFPDAAAVSAWAEESVSWAVDAGVLRGVELPGGGRLLDPAGSLTRAQTAAVLQRLW